MSSNKDKKEDELSSSISKSMTVDNLKDSLKGISTVKINIAEKYNKFTSPKIVSFIIKI